MEATMQAYALYNAYGKYFTEDNKKMLEEAAVIGKKFAVDIAAFWELSQAMIKKADYYDRMKRAYDAENDNDGAFCFPVDAFDTILAEDGAPKALPEEAGGNEKAAGKKFIDDFTFNATAAVAFVEKNNDAIGTLTADLLIAVAADSCAQAAEGMKILSDALKEETPAAKKRKVGGGGEVVKKDGQ
jgi:hypothetical protein